jgi:HAD superfamily 5'-nucleotidase-like hydrolase
MTSRVRDGGELWLEGKGECHTIVEEPGVVAIEREKRSCHCVQSIGRCVLFFHLVVFIFHNFVSSSMECGHKPKIPVVAFDADHTLVQYQQVNLFWMMVDVFTERLYEKRGIPSEIMDHNLCRELIVRGLVIDTAYGNVYMVQKNKEVSRLFHGEKEITDPQKWSECVPSERILEVKSVFSGQSIPEAKLFCCSTAFDLPLPCLYGKLVRMWEGRELDSVEEAKDITFEKLFEWLYETMHSNFSDWMLPNGYFQNIRENTEKFVARNGKMQKWLVRMAKDVHAAGGLVILITNSFLEYAEYMMEYSYGTDWRSVFDVVITLSRKPVFFFSSKNSFVDLTKGEETMTIHPSTPAMTTYEGGNATDLITSISAYLKIDPDLLDLVYVGDHPFGDVTAPHKCSWRSVAVTDRFDVDIAMDGMKDEDERKRLWTRWREDVKESYLWRLMEEHAEAILTDITQLDAEKDSSQLRFGFPTDFTCSIS